MTRPLVVDARTDVASGVVQLDLVDPAGAALPEWAPGAHIDLHLPGGHLRQYSLCGDPADRSRWQVAVLREPEGRGGSACVHDKVAVGDELAVAGPRNHFPLVDAPAYLFVAGGIGITPIRPMIAEIERRGRPWRLVYGGRTRPSMAYVDELSAGGRPVTVCPQDEVGLLDLDAVLPAAGADAAVYCCGPEGLLRAVEERVPAGRLHVERFAPKPVSGVDAPFEVTLAGSGRTLPVPAGCSILTALEQAGVTVLSSCREGTCGTCETGMLEGVPDHRDSVLTPGEQAAGDVMMICVSRASSPRLVLDL